MPEWVSTLIVAAVAASGAWVAAKVAGRSGEYGRIRDLESRVDKVESRNTLLWEWNRELLDHIYKGKGWPPPTRPEGLD